ncbi:MAG: hypothetical protein ACRBB0_17385 [Pelagimonas sp.]|uniref:hypothetical protein n=1 Tax=Pelagimonas sp. TaxID=2073170 RepID=UPI003D6AA582
MCHDFYYSRPFQAELIADKLTSGEAAQNPSDFYAQFLTSPQHTGKTAFLKRDLIPLLRDSGYHTLYFDLWAQPNKDSGKALADFLAGELTDVAVQHGVKLTDLRISKVALGSYMSALPVVGGRRKGSLSTALSEIATYSGKPVVFIVDEVQEAWETSTGQAALAALRQASRDLGPKGEARLHLIFAGSHRGKLGALVHKRNAPFYGAEVREFTRLGRDFIEALVGEVNPRLASANQLNTEDVEAAFELLGYQPQTLTQVLMEHAMGTAGSDGLRQTVTRSPDILRRRIWEQHQDGFGTLNEMQRSVLTLLIEDGNGFSPFAARTLERIGERMGDMPTAPKVQKALDALRDKGLVWKPGRGSYALEDQDMREWLLSALAA